MARERNSAADLFVEIRGQRGIGQGKKAIADRELSEASVSKWESILLRQEN